MKPQLYRDTKKYELFCLLARLFQSQVAVFVISWFLGCLLAVIWFNYNAEVAIRRDMSTFKPANYLDTYSWWLSSLHLRREPMDYDVMSYGNLNGSIVSESAFLSKKIHVVCLVFVRNEKTGTAVKNTWGRRCSETVLVGLFHNEDLPVRKLTPSSSWHWLCDSLRWVWKTHREKLMWMLVASDDTYVLPENLRSYVAGLDHHVPYYLGHAMRFWGEVYNLGQSGYVLSRGTLKKFIRKFNTSESCVRSGKYWKNEDWYLGKHLATLGIKPQDTRDYLGRGRFNAFSITQLLFPGSLSIYNRYWRDSVYLSRDKTKTSCSDVAITFHGIDGGKMYLLDYFLYQVRPFCHGGTLGNKPAPTVQLPQVQRSEESRMNYIHWQYITTPKNFMHMMNKMLEF